jgi:hypothetical protein
MVQSRARGALQRAMGRRQDDLRRRLALLHDACVHCPRGLSFASGVDCVARGAAERAGTVYVLFCLRFHSFASLFPFPFPFPAFSSHFRRVPGSGQNSGRDRH